MTDRITCEPDGRIIVHRDTVCPRCGEDVKVAYIDEGYNKEAMERAFDDLLNGRKEHLQHGCFNT